MNLNIFIIFKYIILIIFILCLIKIIKINKNKILKFFKKIRDLKYSFALGIVMFISLIYICICTYMMLPYLKIFLNNGYIIETNDLPNFSSVFESLFVVLAMISSTLLGYMTYKVSKNQMLISQNQVNSDYNKNISSPSIIVYTHLKIKLIYDLDKIIKKHMHILKDEEYESKSGTLNAIETLKEEMVDVKLSQDINSYVPCILSLFKEDRLVLYFITLIEDLNSENKITYIFKNEYIENSILKETSSKLWVEIRYAILFDRIDKLEPYLIDTYYNIFKKIKELSKPKEIG